MLEVGKKKALSVIKNKKSKIEKFNEGSKLAGNVYQEFLMDTEFMQRIKWGEFLGSAFNKWLLKNIP